MRVHHVTLQDLSSAGLAFSQIQDVTQALQIQLDRDFTPIWGVHAVVQALDAGEKVPKGAWPMMVLDQPDAGLGVHLNKGRKPFAEIEFGDDWSITASHELLEMLVDPLGHKLISDRGIDPDSDGHQVHYLVEVGDPCEVFDYSINGIKVSDFITKEFYEVGAPNGTQFDFLGRLDQALEVPRGCYISWIDPEDQRWHQKRPDGSFITAQKKANAKKSPRDQRDAAFGDDENESRHDLLAIRREHRQHSGGAVAKKRRPARSKR
jgi:hypothetical protein